MKVPELDRPATIAQRRRDRLVPKLLLSVTALLLVLAVGEGVYRVRALRMRRARLAGRGEAELMTRAAPLPLGYELKPSFGEVTNSHGFRDLERTVARRPGVFRIAALGDSVTMQGALPFDQLYVSQLQRRFDAAAPGRVELLNFGITGYNSVQEAGLLQERVLDFDPDLVLWQFHDNDGQHELYSASLGAFYHRPTSYLANHVANKLDHFFCRQRARRHPDAPLGGDEANLLCHWQRVEDSFSRAVQTLASRNIPLVVFLYPSWPLDDRWENYGRVAVDLRARLTDYLRKRGATVIDLLPLLMQVDPAEYRVEPSDPWHPNARGHELIADALFRSLEPLVPGSDSVPDPEPSI